MSSLHGLSHIAQDTFGTEGSREMDATETTKMSVGDVLFLQTDDSSQMPRERAYRALKKIIGHSKNLRLARLAVAVRTALRFFYLQVRTESCSNPTFAQKRSST